MKNVSELLNYCQLLNTNITKSERFFVAELLDFL